MFARRIVGGARLRFAPVLQLLRANLCRSALRAGKCISAASLAVVRYAARLAASLGASLQVMHVLGDSMSSAAFIEMYTALPEDYFEG